MSEFAANVYVSFFNEALCDGSEQSSQGQGDSSCDCDNDAVDRSCHCEYHVYVLIMQMKIDYYIQSKKYTKYLLAVKRIFSVQTCIHAYSMSVKFMFPIETLKR